MNRPDYVPVSAWHWLKGEVVDLSMFRGAEDVVPGLLSVDMEPSWRSWAKQVDSDEAWYLLCDFLALLPWTYQPQHIQTAGRIRQSWLQTADDLLDIAQQLAFLHREALDIGLDPPLSDEDLDTLMAVATAIGEGDVRPVRAEFDYLNADRPSSQAFVQHFDARWAYYSVLDGLHRVRMSHADVVRIGVATGLAHCTEAAVGRARKRKPTFANPHDPERGVCVFGGSGKSEPDK